MIRETIFVFGSNLAGRHGKGAARFAVVHHGAHYGQGYGIQGSAYAIPTKDKQLETLPLETILNFVSAFLRYARQHPSKRFKVTRIGCGLAGYNDSDIAPMFEEAPENCIFDKAWAEFLPNREYFDF